jgi:hypothetical protein
MPIAPKAFRSVLKAVFVDVTSFHDKKQIPSGRFWIPISRAMNSLFITPIVSGKF